MTSGVARGVYEMCTSCLFRPGIPRAGCEQLSALHASIEATIEGQRALEVDEADYFSRRRLLQSISFLGMRCVPVICAVKFYVSRRASQSGMTSIIAFADRSNIPSEMTARKANLPYPRPSPTWTRETQQVAVEVESTERE